MEGLDLISSSPRCTFGLFTGDGLAALEFVSETVVCVSKLPSSLQDKAPSLSVLDTIECVTDTVLPAGEDCVSNCTYRRESQQAANFPERPISISFDFELLFIFPHDTYLCPALNKLWGSSLGTGLLLLIFVVFIP